MTLINKGLSEYEIKQDRRRTIALTLLRGVGYLSKEKIPERSNMPCAMMLPTPGAQNLGRHVFEYSLFPHRGDWKRSKVFIPAQKFNLPMRVVQTSSHSGKLPKQKSFISLYPNSFIVSAVKKGENRDALVLRFYNPSDEKIQGKIKFWRKIREAKLLKLSEEVIKQLPKEEDTVKLEVGKHKIITLEVTLL